MTSSEELKLSEKIRTLIIGAGPAGLFCAEELLNRGHRANEIMLIDSGSSMKERCCPQSLDCDCKTCDILEGVGGAGGFSDGKMTLSLGRGTQTEPIFRAEDESILNWIDHKMVMYGGEGKYHDPISGEAKSDFYRKVESAGFKFDTYKLRHLGSDGAKKMIERQEMILRLCQVKFKLNTEVDHLIWHWAENCKKKVTGVCTVSGQQIFADNVVIATGLQGEPWVRKQAKELGVRLLSGSAGIGIRLETSADNLSALFDTFYDFKLELKTPIGQLRSFCCNREGYIVNENHQKLMIRNVNGHSNLAAKLRSNSSNFAIIAKVDHEHTEGMSPQVWVRDIARRINSSQGMPVVQYAYDFISGVSSDKKTLDANPVRTNHQAIAGPNMAQMMPDDLEKSFQQFLATLDGVLPHGLGNDAVVYGPEIKYYGYRFPVNGNWKSTDVENLHTIGNASGYLDSYVSAAVSGVIAARDIANQ